MLGDTAPKDQRDQLAAQTAELGALQSQLAGLEGQITALQSSVRAQLDASQPLLDRILVRFESSHSAQGSSAPAALHLRRDDIANQVEQGKAHLAQMKTDAVGAFAAASSRVKADQSTLVEVNQQLTKLRARLAALKPPNFVMLGESGQDLKQPPKV